MGGAVFMAEVEAGGATLLPIDSEHNAIFQCLPAGYARNPAHAGVRRILLTASGGPFRTRALADLARVSPDEACAHPNWSMGRKISVDSATMMNKGLEVIEARWLFGAPREAIEVVIHPQSVIHSLVEYADGSVLAQLGNPDMRTPIAQALAYPGAHRRRGGAARTRATRGAVVRSARLRALSLPRPRLSRAGGGRHGARGAQRGERSGGGRLPGGTQPLHRHRGRLRGNARAASGPSIVVARRRDRRPTRRRAASPGIGLHRGNCKVQLRHDRSRLQGAVVPGHAGRARGVPRARALRRRALVRRQGAALFGGLRPRDRLAPVRSGSHRVGAVGHSAGRLREDGRRTRRRRRARRSRARVQPPERVEAHRDRGRGPDRQPAARGAAVRGHVHERHPRAARDPGRNRRPDRRRPPPASAPATSWWRSTASR